MASRTTGRLASTLSLAAMLLGTAGTIVASGCVSGCEAGSWSGLSVVKATRTLTTTSEANMALSVEASNGSVEVTAAAVTEVKITAEVRALTQERLDAAVVKAERVNGELKIWAEWPDGRKSNEGVAFAIQVPEAALAKTRVNSSNGSLTLTGLSGTLSASSSNGAIKIKDQAGAVTARTSNGSVTVEGASGPLTISTSNGSVRAKVSSPSTAAGDPAERVIDISTSNGSVTLGLPADFAGELALDTSNGRITAPTRAEGADKGSKTSKRLRFGNATSPVSKVRTSNGSITIE